MMEVKKDTVKSMFSKVWLVALGCSVFYVLINGAVYHLAEYIFSVMFSSLSATAKLCTMIGIFITLLVCAGSFCCLQAVRNKSESIQQR